MNETSIDCALENKRGPAPRLLPKRDEYYERMERRRFALECSDGSINNSMSKGVTP